MESKRAILPRAADYTKKFFKDWNRLSRSGRYDMRGYDVIDAPLGQDIVNAISTVTSSCSIGLMTAESTG
ncbi:hypothetical protein VU10_00490 [Desulfobulbus sp. US1]|nr:hypothetical protein [Desulfobulbus sp. US4]MCW5208702.1 hypothetical protein [Desulfobulbus sp. US1]MCW5213856.1 hypothetical protein [Desulfobulbus sp. US5]